MGKSPHLARGPDTVGGSEWRAGVGEQSNFDWVMGSSHSKKKRFFGNKTMKAFAFSKGHGGHGGSVDFRVTKLFRQARIANSVFPDVLSSRGRPDEGWIRKKKHISAHEVCGEDDPTCRSFMKKIPLSCSFLWVLFFRFSTPAVCSLPCVRLGSCFSRSSRRRQPSCIPKYLQKIQPNNQSSRSKIKERKWSSWFMEATACSL